MTLVERVDEEMLIRYRTDYQSFLATFLGWIPPTTNALVRGQLQDGPQALV